MRVLVIYYSRTGTTKAIAELIREQLNCDIEEIVSVKDRSGVTGYLLCGREAAKKEMAEIKPVTKNPADYDLTIIGTPIWAWNISSPIRAYLMQNVDRFQKIAAFCTMGGGGEKRAFAEIESICKKKPIAALAVSEKEIQAENFKDKVKRFVTDIL